MAMLCYNTIMYKRVTFGFFVMVLGVVLGGHWVVAVSMTDINPTTVTITLTPASPKPHTTVTATVHSNNVNVQTAEIAWMLDGEPLAAGTGVSEASFALGAVGTEYALSVAVRTDDGAILVDSITVRPASVYLAWEGDTWTPPLFLGRALYSTGSSVRLEAFAQIADANGALVPPEQLLYTWRRGTTILTTLSGVGKKSIVVDGPKFLGSDVYSVDVATPDDAVHAIAGALIATSEPHITLYEDDPSLGVRTERAVAAEYETPGSSIAVRAFPYYADATSPDSAELFYSWRVGTNDIDTSDDEPSRVVLATDERGGLSAQVSLVIDHAYHLLQSATSELRIRFGSIGGGASLFGF